MTTSPNFTIVGASQSITDSAGNNWTISPAGVVSVGGKATAYTGVSVLAYIGGEVIGIDVAQLVAPTAPPKPTPSPNDTVVSGTSGSIVDVSGNTWTINGSGQVEQNGSPAGQTSTASQIATVNGGIWYMDNIYHWWQWNGQNWVGGSYSSPVPGIPSTQQIPTSKTSPNLDIGQSLVDFFGDTFVVTSSERVTINGIDTGASSTTGLAYIFGTMWSVNTSGGWYFYTPTGWSSGNGFTNPLPT